MMHNLREKDTTQVAVMVSIKFKLSCMISDAVYQDGEGTISLDQAFLVQLEQQMASRFIDSNGIKILGSVTISAGYYLVRVVSVNGSLYYEVLIPYAEEDSDGYALTRALINVNDARLTILENCYFGANQ